MQSFFKKGCDETPPASGYVPPKHGLNVDSTHVLRRLLQAHQLDGIMRAWSQRPNEENAHPPPRFQR
jgi:hypothetical protein